MIKDKKESFIKLDKTEKIKIFVSYYILFFIISYIFYKNIYVAIVLGFASMFIYKMKVKEKIKSKREKMIKEFGDFIKIFESAVLTGDESTNAFKYSVKEFKKIVSDKSILYKELEELIRKVDVYGDLSALLLDLACKINEREIINFARSFSVAEKTLGDIGNVIKNTTEVITNRIESNSDIQKMFYEKKYELKIILCIPILIFLFLSVTAPEYISPLYTSVSGYIVLTLSLLLLLGAYALSDKLTEI